MPGFFNKYPYTDFHELNLDWLLEHYSDLVNQLNEINSWISQHKIDYANAISELDRLSNEIDTFELQIRTSFEQLKAEQQQQLDKAISDLNFEVDQKIRQLENESQKEEK